MIKTFVLDTSVLLSDPRAMGRFAEHEVVLPLAVIPELGGQRDHTELGWIATPARPPPEPLTSPLGRPLAYRAPRRPARAVRRGQAAWTQVLGRTKVSG
mgnify:CR=1 FL=1